MRCCYDILRERPSPLFMSLGCSLEEMKEWSLLGQVFTLLSSSHPSSTSYSLLVFLSWSFYCFQYLQFPLGHLVFSQFGLSFCLHNPSSHLSMCKHLGTPAPYCWRQYTECPRRNVPDFGRVFLMLKYTDITQNTYIQSWMVYSRLHLVIWNIRTKSLLCLI